MTDQEIVDYLRGKHLTGGGGAGDGRTERQRLNAAADRIEVQAAEVARLTAELDTANAGLLEAWKCADDWAAKGQDQKARAETAEAEVARLRDHVGWCVALLDALVAESKEQIEYGQEDAFRMGEWFTDEELGIIERARAASKPKP